MKKLLGASIAAMLVAAPALAAANVIRFEPSDGEAVTMTFNDDGTVSADNGSTGTYTWDEDTKTICGTFEGAEAELCATFEEVSYEAGFSTTYTATNGNSGTATLVEVKE